VNILLIVETPCIKYPVPKEEVIVPELPAEDIVAVPVAQVLQEDSYPLIYALQLKAPDVEVLYVEPESIGLPEQDVPAYHLYRIFPPLPPVALHVKVNGPVPVGLLTEADEGVQVEADVTVAVPVLQM
jgi:hypothetical protein